MKTIILCALFAAASAGYLAPAAPAVVAAPVVARAAIVNTGASVSQRSQDGYGNYAFGYNEHGATGGTFRRESGNAVGQVVGSYGLSAADGRRRVVNYVADGLGFRAQVSTNEPGTAPSLPAHAPTNVGVAAAPIAKVVAAPAVAAVAAPAIAAPALAAPAYAAPAYAAPAIAAAPVAVAAAPVAAYGTAVSHVAAAPVAAVAAPVAHAKVLAAPAYGYAARPW